MLQPVHGGANARPFVTHINAYDMRLYLRIAPELYLKRLMVGGIERVFELNRNFRNEGADATHNPEFTMLEAYEAYGDYDSMQLARAGADPGRGPRRRRGTTVDPASTASSTTSAGSGGRSPSTTRSPRRPASTITADTARRRAARASPTPPASTTTRRGDAGRCSSSSTSTSSRHRRWRPTFYRDFPTDVSPLTRQHRVDPRLAERWDLVAFGAEIGTAYSELIDPVEQRRRLTEQSLLAAGGDPEAMELDEDFLRALEYAMPPTGGLGMGVDRLVMMLTGKNIRDTVLFPLVRPQ